MPDILICDDDPTARFLLKRVLVRELDATVTETTDGLQALRLLTTRRFDALILDLRMPVMDGPETLEVVRNTPELRDIPVIVLSSETDADVIKRVVHAGVTDYLLKPLSRTGTQQRLMHIIEKLRERDRMPSPPPRTVNTGFNLTPGATIVVADPAEDFRYFCCATLGRRFNIVEATNGVEAFDAALRHAPAAMLIGRGLTMVSSDALAQKVRVTTRHPIALIAVATHVEIEALQASGLFDGCLVKTFVAESFQQSLDALGFAPSPLARLVDRVPGLRTTVISATEQVFGMMVKMDVELVGDHMPPFTGGPVLAGTIPLTVADEFEIDLDLTCTEESANLFAVAMFGVPEPNDVLSELANIVAGRVRHAITNHNLNATLGLPSVERVGDQARRAPELSTRFGVIGTANQLDISLRVRERAHAAAVSSTRTQG